MIVDASAILAILRNEATAADCASALASARDARMSCANWLEAAIVVDSTRDPIARRRFDELVREAQVKIEPVTEEQARIAREAYRDFGKGSGHKAQLNFGDCFAYALAKTAEEPLLFTGRDFSETDLRSAIGRP